METTLQLAAWGGSTALRIPKPFLQQLNITEKSTVKIKLNENNELVVVPVYQHKTLEERFQGWDRQPPAPTDEDKAWLEMEGEGAEIW